MKLLYHGPLFSSSSTWVALIALKMLPIERYAFSASKLWTKIFFNSGKKIFCRCEKKSSKIFEKIFPPPSCSKKISLKIFYNWFFLLKVWKFSMIFFHYDFFSPELKNIFVHSFDAKKTYLSIGEVFKAIAALPHRF